MTDSIEAILREVDNTQLSVLGAAFYQVLVTVADEEHISAEDFIDLVINSTENFCNTNL